MDYFIRARHVVFPDGTRSGTLRVVSGKIASLEPYEAELRAQGPVVSVPDTSILMPALVDTHAHINEPGRTDWEGFTTATQAAAAGGIGTVVDMPLNCIPATTSVKAFRAKRDETRGKCWTDLGFWGGVIPGNQSELQGMVEDGVLGFKAFLVPSGVPEFPHSTLVDLQAALPVLRKANVPLLVHAELELHQEPVSGDERSYATYLKSRPKTWENEAIQHLIGLAKKSGARIHIVHLSSAEALPAIAAAKKMGISITAETCPHYLLLDAESIPDGATQFKCAPPIREKANQERLWEGLRDGTIDFIVSDHSPCTPHMKRPETGDFMSAWGGIASLQFGLSLLWTAARRRGFSLDDLTRWTSERTAHFAGLAAKKGQIAVGKDADLIEFAPQEAFIIEESRILHRHKTCPYLGQRATGTVRRTIVRGETIFKDGSISEKALGELQLGRA